MKSQAPQSQEMLKFRLPMKSKFCSFGNTHYEPVIKQPHIVSLYRTQAFLRAQHWWCSVFEKLFSNLVYHHYSVSFYLFTHMPKYVLFNDISFSSIPYVMSQDNRIIQVGQDLRRSSVQLKAGSAVRLDEVAQGFIQSNSESPQGWRPHSFSGQHIQLPGYPLCEKAFL